jgi:hypothetical protein
LAGFDTLMACVYSWLLSTALVTLDHIAALRLALLDAWMRMRTYACRIDGYTAYSI